MKREVAVITLFVILAVVSLSIFDNLTGVAYEDEFAGVYAYPGYATATPPATRIVPIPYVWPSTYVPLPTLSYTKVYKYTATPTPVATKLPRVAATLTPTVDQPASR